MDEPDASPLADAVARVGDRWSLLIVDALLDGPRRFTDLQEAIAGLAPNILSARLKHLEREGVLLARPYSERPPRFDYELTAAGGDLAGALRLLARWGARSTEEHGPRHSVCGTALETRWYCPTCDLVVETPDATELHRV
ncbi:MAG TPA: helix-turn-helix domain-containing protein [Actinomycetota bacterium]|nr:helix-turn-helix domain-containing protein [Actinomycetota bacterium]